MPGKDRQKEDTVSVVLILIAVVNLVDGNHKRLTEDCCVVVCVCVCLHAFPDLSVFVFSIHTTFTTAAC